MADLAELPQLPTPEQDPDHQLVEHDLSHLANADRWQLSLLLDAEGIGHHWSGATLVAPKEADAVGEIDVVLNDDVPEPGDDVRPPGTESRRAVLAAADNLTRSADATWGPIVRRIGAAIVDYVLLNTTVSVIYRIWDPRAARGLLIEHRPTVTSVVLLIAIRAAYDIIAIGKWGRTPGKAIFGLRVLDLRHQRAGWVRATTRYVVSDLALIVIVALPTVPNNGAALWYLAAQLCVYGPILFDPLQRGLHDRAAGTIVVRTRG